MRMLVSSMSRTARKRTLPCISCAFPTVHSAGISTAGPPSPGNRQRRYSSSKTSDPPSDDARSITAPSDSPAEGTAPRPGSSPRKRPASRISRQRLKEALLPKTPASIPDTMLSRLPFVATTEHLHPHDVHMASFFSLHRPMSVTAVIPPPSSPSTFSSIFTPRVQHKPRAADIIYTLSTAVNTLEKAAAAEAAPPSAPSPQPLSHDTLRAAVTQASASTADAARSTHLDGQPPQGLQIDIEELARNFRPFNPPPAPVPTTSSIPPATVAGASTLATGPRILSMARAFLQPDPSTTDLYTELERIAQAGWTFRARMRQRSRVWADGRAETRREMWKAISVKRQRKLKMKKHKYKKLMRKTRNLRRRLDRL